MRSYLKIPQLAGKSLHLGVTGSIAAYKALDLLRMWGEAGLMVSATLTESARQFVQPLSFSSLGADPLYESMFINAGPAGHTGFAHLEPGQLSGGMVIAPATANFLAKLACGLADDLLSCQALSFPGPLVIAPAMNPRLWQATATQENWAKLKSRGHYLIEPEHGIVACGEEGRGRLPALEQIYLTALKALTSHDLAGRRILITLGPTREAWDPVRFWSNPSSGLMGASLAVTAWLRGARVTVVAGPVQDLWLPLEIERHDVVSAEEMFETCMDLWPGLDTACFVAAVADFCPVPFGPDKFKKQSSPDGFNLQFVPNPDILAEISKQARPDRNEVRIMAFAAETGLDQDMLKLKLAGKGADLLVANDLNQPGAGFAVDTNAVTVMDRQGRIESWPVLPKPEVAWRLWDWLGQI